MHQPSLHQQSINNINSNHWAASIRAVVMPLILREHITITCFSNVVTTESKFISLLMLTRTCCDTSNKV